MTPKTSLPYIDLNILAQKYETRLINQNLLENVIQLLYKIIRLAVYSKILR